MNLSSLLLCLVSFLQILIYYDNDGRLLLKQFICWIFTLYRLCVHQQCGLFQCCGAVVTMSQLRLRSSSFHEHGSGSGALSFHGSGFCSFSHVISRLSSQLASELFVRTYVVGANLAVVLFNCINKQILIIRANFGDQLMLWLKLTILFSKAFGIHLNYAIHFTNNVRQSQTFNWVTEIGIRL